MIDFYSSGPILVKNNTKQDRTEEKKEKQNKTAPTFKLGNIYIDINNVGLFNVKAYRICPV